MTEPRDRGAVDVSIEMLFGFIALVVALLLVVEAAAYWHTRNVFDEAAAEGARVAAAYDGTCADGLAAARAMITRHAGSWGRRVQVWCTDGATVVVTVEGAPMGVLSAAAGLTARVVEFAPKER